MRSSFRGQPFANKCIRYLHRLTLSIDANFRQVLKYRPTSNTDTPLFGGLGVQPPWDVYHAWLRRYVTEEEVRAVHLMVS